MKAASRSRDIYWSPWNVPGLEHLRLTLGERGAIADGMILRLHEGMAIRARYRVEADATWLTRTVRLAVHYPESRILQLEGDGDGHWQRDGAPAPDLDGCLDVDIEVTPFTNTLPIRRLGLGLGDRVPIRVVYLALLPALALHPAEQCYTCLDRIAHGGMYRYESMQANAVTFAADLPVDSDGVVHDYPGQFRRVSGP